MHFVGYLKSWFDSIHENHENWYPTKYNESTVTKLTSMYENSIMNILPLALIQRVEHCIYRFHLDNSFSINPRTQFLYKTTS